MADGGDDWHGGGGWSGGRGSRGGGHSDGWSGGRSWRGRGRGSRRGNSDYNRYHWHKSEDSATTGGSHRGGRKRDSGKKRHERNDSGEQRERPPPGLKGREIGMWYAARSKGQQQKRNDYNSVLRIDSQKERDLTNLLATIQSTDRCPPQPTRSYTQPDSYDNQNETAKCDSSSDFTQNYNQSQISEKFGQQSNSHGQSQSYTHFRKQTGNLHQSYSEGSSQSYSSGSSSISRSSSLFESPSQTQNRSSSSLNAASQSRSSSLFDDDPSLLKEHEVFDDSDSDLDDDKLIEMTQDMERNYLLEASTVSPTTQSDTHDESYLEDEMCDEYNNEQELQQELELGLFEDNESDFMFEFRKHNEENRRSHENLSKIELETHLLLHRDQALDQRLLDQSEHKQISKDFKRMEEFRKKLPSYKMRQDILKLIGGNQVVVISGETGCGKTTQVPQFILDDYISRGEGSLCRVVCTQPRRISAISVAERVAEERAEKCGQSTVGYQIRLDAKLPNKQGSILYCTTGIMLQWLASDKLLSQTSHVVLDEIHERDLHSDFLMIILRDLLAKRRDLKLVLMSATLNAEQFSQYFSGCPMINIPGFTFSVKEYLLEEVVQMIRYQPSARMTRKPPGIGRKKTEERSELERYNLWCNSLHARKEVENNMPYSDIIQKDKSFLLRKGYSRSTCEVMKSLCNFELVDTDICAQLVEFIVSDTEDGAILIFLPGWSDIKNLCDKLESRAIFRNKAFFRIIPLHSLMPTVNQKQVFERPPPGVRKIIIATNIAETSITIDDVVYVIDCGKIKMKNFDAEHNVQTLKPEWVSKANAKQRRGRAGRVQPGVCYHLYSGYHEETLADYQLPEMLRTRLEELCLHIKLLKLGFIQPFVEKAMQPPSMAALTQSVQVLRDLPFVEKAMQPTSMVVLTQSLQVLRDLNAMDSNEDLTPLGYHLAKMPVDPHSGKMLLFAAMFSCIDPIMTVAASLSFKDAFYIPMGKEKAADARRRELSQGTQSDHIMLVNAYKGWERAVHRGTAWQYCRDNFLSHHTLKMLCDMRRQFAKILADMKFLDTADPKCPSANRNSGNMKLLKAIVCAGLFPNVARILSVKAKGTERPNKMSTQTDRAVYFHPKSVNSQETDFTSQWVVYHLKMKVNKVCLFDSTVVSPLSLLFFGGEINVAKNAHYKKKLGGNSHHVDIGGHVTLSTNQKTCALVSQLRVELDRLLEYKITHPGVTNWNQSTKEGALTHAIVDLIKTEKEEPPNFRVVGKKRQRDNIMCENCGEKGHFSRRCNYRFS